MQKKNVSAVSFFFLRMKYIFAVNPGAVYPQRFSVISPDGWQKLCLSTAIRFPCTHQHIFFQKQIVKSLKLQTSVPPFVIVKWKKLLRTRLGRNRFTYYFCVKDESSRSKILSDYGKMQQLCRIHNSQKHLIIDCHCSMSRFNSAVA